MAYSNKERYEFIERMFSGLDNIPPSKVIGTFIPLTGRGRHSMGLCPFHRDTKLGSFLVTDDKGIWKCFTCGDEYAGNAVKFVSLYRNMTYLEAAFDIAVNFGVITRDEFDKYSKKKYDDGYVKKLEKRYSDKAKDEPKPKKAIPEVIHNVYWIMKEMSPLTDEHRRALEEDRRLSPERIRQDYFSCPVNWRQRDAIVAAIKKRFPKITDDILKTVPGFYYDKKQKKITFSGYKGICILIRDAKGMIRAVQIRRDTIKEGEARYVWMSSTFAFYKPDEYDGGCGCGSPKDVLWASDLSRKILCITEGRFKSEVLAANGNTTISIQGVTSWNGIIDTIKAIREKQNIDSVFIFLDSDILGKHALFTQSIKMCAAIQSYIPDLKIRYAFWHKSVGKGIDDYIYNSGSIKGISYVNCQTASEASDKCFNKCLEKYGVARLQDLKQENVESFEEDLQNMLENLLVK